MPTMLANLLRRRIVRRTLIALAALFLLYTVFGFFIVPRIVISQAKEFAAQKLHRTLAIEKLEFNPYTLRATIHGFKLMEAQDAGTFAAFDALTVKLSWQSLFRFAPVVQQVLLQKPEVHLVREDAHRYNFDQLAADLAGPPTPPEKDPKPARFAVYNIEVDDGRIEFEDKPKSAKHVITDFKLGVPFVSSLPSQEEVFVEPLLQAKVNGSSFRLAGRALPFAEAREATLDVNLDDIDLAHYLEYLPFEPQFKVPSARLDLHVSASFKQPKDRTPALFLSGDAALKALQVTEPGGKAVLTLPELAVKLGKSDIFEQRIDISRVALNGLTLELTKEADGRFNLQRLFDTGKSDAQAATAATIPAPEKKEAPSPGLQLAIDEFAIQGAGLHYKDDAKATQASLDKFDLAMHQTRIDPGKRTVSVAGIDSSSADAVLGVGRHAPASDAPTKIDAKPAADGEPPFLVTLDKLAIANWSARIDDRSHDKAVTTTLGPLSLNLQDLSTAPKAIATLDLKSAVNKSGQVAINGKFGFNPMHTDLALDVKAVDLLGVQPYITDRVNLLLTSANLSAKGGLKLDAGSDDALHGGFTGDLTLGNLATIDKVSGDDFVRWKTLALSGVDVKLAPFSLNIAQVGMNDFFARVIIDPAGHINLQDIVRSSPGDKKSLTTASATPAAAPAPPTPAAPAASATPPPPIKIGKLVLGDGKVRYTDNFITPHYTANLMGLGGQVGGLSSDPASRASVDLHGQVNEAPLTIAGAINPLKGDLSLDIKAKVTGMELAPLSPYSGRYVGYGIEEGKLSFEVAYQIEQRKLTAQNRLILDQLTFGDKVDSPQATHLPVQFAVALLRDRNGVIDINLPIGGSLDDPDFSVGGLIVKVIINVVTKAVTEPFALLGSMFGGGKELSTAPFDAGSHAVNAETEERLKAMAKALGERPALKLEITGWADPETDRPALKRAALNSKLRALKAKDLAARKVSNEDSVTVTPQEYPALLARAYKAEKFDKPKNAVGLTKDLPVADMEKLMLDNTTIGDDDLAALGNQRAQAVEQWLLTNGKIPGERIFIIAAKTGAPIAQEGKDVSPGRVDFSLR
jgi:uncharacterized protein involved in outer membrane biogenesis